MMMLLIGALVIGYLLYFFTSSFRTWSNQRAVDRTPVEIDQHDRPIGQDGNTADLSTQQLEDRIAVLERLIKPPIDKSDTE